MLIVRSTRNKDLIMASLQPEVGKVVAWSDKVRLTLNTSKYEIAFFNLDCAEVVWQPNITINGKRMFCNPFQVFLGVRYGQQLTFAEHVQMVCQSISDRFNILCALGGTTWGWHTSYCHYVYIAIVRGMFEYTAAAWAPWLSATSTSKLEKVQLEAARDITSLVRSTPVEAVLAESHCLLFQCVCKPSPFLRLTSGPIFQQPTIVVKPYSPHADRA